MQVKQLLEAGHTMHKPLLQALVQHFAEFAHGVGMKRFNEFLLPVFTFVQKCCGVSEDGLQQLLHAHNIDRLVYASQAGGRPITPLNPLTRPSSRSLQNPT
jgi:hypothetical protein